MQPALLRVQVFQRRPASAANHPPTQGPWTHSLLPPLLIALLSSLCVTPDLHSSALRNTPPPLRVFFHLLPAFYIDFSVICKHHAIQNIGIYNTVKNIARRERDTSRTASEFHSHVPYTNKTLRLLLLPRHLTWLMFPCCCRVCLVLRGTSDCLERRWVLRQSLDSRVTALTAQPLFHRDMGEKKKKKTVSTVQLRQGQTGNRCARYTQV